MVHLDKFAFVSSEFTKNSPTLLCGAIFCDTMKGKTFLFALMSFRPKLSGVSRKRSGEIPRGRKGGFIGLIFFYRWGFLDYGYASARNDGGLVSLRLVGGRTRNDLLMSVIGALSTY